jgi:hypothetical protein
MRRGRGFTLLFDDQVKILGAVRTAARGCFRSCPRVDVAREDTRCRKTGGFRNAPYAKPGAV